MGTRLGANGWGYQEVYALYTQQILHAQSKQAGAMMTDHEHEWIVGLYTAKRFLAGDPIPLINKGLHVYCGGCPETLSIPEANAMLNAAQMLNAENADFLVGYWTTHQWFGSAEELQNAIDELRAYAKARGE